MTCDEARSFAAGDPANVTRGMRASVAAHMRRCESCLDWALSQGPPERNSADEELLRQDLEDEEFVNTVFGGDGHGTPQAEKDFHRPGRAPGF